MDKKPSQKLKGDLFIRNSKKKLESFANLFFSIFTDMKDLLTKLSYVIGLNYFEPPHRCFRRDVLYVSLVFIFLMLFYSFSLDWPDVKQVFLSTMPTAFGFQALIRLFIYLHDAHLGIELFGKITSFYERNEEFHDQRRSMGRCVDIVRKVAYSVAFLYFVCFFEPFVFCVINFLLTGSTVTPYPVTLPFVDRHSVRGFMVNTPVHLSMNFIIFFGFSSNDSLACLFVIQEKVFVDAVKRNLSIISEILNAKDRNDDDISQQLKNLIESHKELKSYHELLCKVLVKPFFVIVVFNTYVICSCGIALLTSDYYSAIGVAISSCCQLLIVCGVGTFTCHQQERLLKALWNFEWYKLKLKDQKDFLTFLTMAQQPLNLEPYFIGVLNMELFIKVS